MNKIVINRYENPWQGFQFVKITFAELGKIDVREIRELLSEDNM